MTDHNPDEIGVLRNTIAEKEQEIAELREKLDNFNKTVAVVRHETNNPLAVVIGQAQFLTTRIGGLPEDVNRRLKVIEEMSQRMRQTLNILESFKQKPPIS
jgi:signal transduction histidine kinase